jgi:hypothetical protein
LAFLKYDLSTFLFSFPIQYRHPYYPVSAQEAVYRLLGLPLHIFDFQAVWIPTGMPHQRVHLLKPKHLLSALEDEEENVFFTGIEDRR